LTSDISINIPLYTLKQLYYQKDMPELPEVETVARTLAPSVVGRRIVKTNVLWPKSMQGALEALQSGPRSIIGRRISAVTRRAKVLLVHLESPDGSNREHDPHMLAFHLKMTGQVMVYPASEPEHKHTRLIFELADDRGFTPAPSVPTTVKRLFFDDTRKFGYCRILTPASLKDWPFWQNLGPEPLEINVTRFRQCFLNCHKQERSGKIKALLLDQAIIAGIGNIYADEALFRAGIAPTTPASALVPRDFTRLHKAVQEVLLESIAACGSSIRNYRDADGNVGAFQNTFHVYGRKGQACHTCGNALVQVRIAGRTTTFCPRCQPEI
jgi:formamidopyrimidine-DNA glycosylase